MWNVAQGWANERTYFQNWNQNIFYKLSWPCRGLAANGHDRGYHSLFTSFLSALHVDVTFCVLHEGLIIQLPGLHKLKQFPESLGQDSRSKVQRGTGCGHVFTVSSQMCVFNSVPTRNNRTEHFKNASVMKDKQRLRNCSRLKEIKGHDKQIQCMILDCIWRRGVEVSLKDMIGATGKIQLWSVC